MDRSAAIRSQLLDGWIPTIYEDKVRSQRTRSYTIDVPLRENTAEIQYTLLGIELKVMKRRFACPDLATARYLRVFARLGCREFAVPYDITKISAIADELETSWQKMLLILDADGAELSRSGKARFRRDVLHTIRLEIVNIGAGPAMPQFSQKTRDTVI